MIKGNEVHTETVGPITFRLFIDQDDAPVRGNAMASGDDAADKAAEDEIIQRLNDGDTWAWASATVGASVDLTGTDHLGALSYHSTAEFLEDCYYESMKAEAREELVKKLETAGVALETLADKSQGPKFSLTIEIGNDLAMEDAHDVANALVELATELRKIKPLTWKVDGGKIMDANGKSVGEWKMTK